MKLSQALEQYAFPYHAENVTSFWQHSQTAQVFSLTQIDDKYGVMILCRETGRWDDNGIKTAEEVVQMAAHVN